MDIERLKYKEVGLRAEYNRLCADELLRLREVELAIEVCAEQKALQPKPDDGLVSKIIDFLRRPTGMIKRHVRPEENEIYAKEETFQPEFDEDFISEIRSFLKALAEEVEIHDQSNEDFYWASNSYRTWLYLLLDRGIPLRDLPPTILGPSKVKEGLETPEKVSKLFSEDSSALFVSAFDKVYKSIARKSFG